MNVLFLESTFLLDDTTCLVAFNSEVRSVRTLLLPAKPSQAHIQHGTLTVPTNKFYSAEDSTWAVPSGPNYLNSEK